MLRRVCDTCERELPLTRFKPSGRGHYRACRECFTQKMRARWGAPPATLRCGFCKEQTKLEDCVRDAGKPYGRRRHCRRCFRERYHWGQKSEHERQRYAERLTRIRRIRRLAEERVLEIPQPKMFKTRDFLPEAEHLARRGSAEGIAEAMRLAALRGIWEGYDRAMRSVRSYGAPPDVGELRGALMEFGIEHELLPSLTTGLPIHRPKKKQRLQESEEDPLEAEADAVLRAG